MIGLSFQTIVLIGVSIAALVVVGLRTRRTLEGNAERIQQVKKAKRAQASQIRQIARQTLRLRRVSQATKTRIREAAEESHRIAGEIEKLQDKDPRLIVLDDRKGPGDRRWQATVSHPNYQKINPVSPPQIVTYWKRGRTFLVWAASAELAQQKIAMRYPGGQGYKLGPISQRPN